MNIDKLIAILRELASWLPRFLDWLGDFPAPGKTLAIYSPVVVFAVLLVAALASLGGDVVSPTPPAFSYDGSGIVEDAICEGAESVTAELSGMVSLSDITLQTSVAASLFYLDDFSPADGQSWQYTTACLFPNPPRIGNYPAEPHSFGPRRFPVSLVGSCGPLPPGNYRYIYTADYRQDGPPPGFWDEFVILPSSDERCQ